MRNVLRAVLASLVAVVVLTTNASTVAAQERGVNEGWVIPHPINSSIDTLDQFLVSGDLTTAVYGSCSHHNAHNMDIPSEVVFIDLATGAEQAVGGSPSSNCKRSIGFFETPEPPFGTGVEALTDDGSALVTTSWEGLAPGDEDGGLRDVALIDRSTFETTLLSGSIDADSTSAIDVSDDGSVAVMLSQTTTADSLITQFHVWRDGSVEEIYPFEDPLSFRDPRSMWLAGDGGYLFFLDGGSISRLDLSTGAKISTPFTGTCCGLEAVGFSDDGQMAAWAGDNTDLDSSLFAPFVTVWDMESTNRLQILGLDTLGNHHPLKFSADKQTLVGASRAYNIEVPPLGGHVVWSLDLPSGRFTKLIDERPFGSTWLRLKGVSDDGQRAVISTMGPAGFQPTPVQIAQGGRAATRTFLWDASLPAPEHPGADPTKANQVERLYRSFFQRSSDDPGRSFWINKMLEGTDLGVIADAFSQSDEFINTYGALDDSQFVDLVYRNVLGREADAEGRSFWIGRLAQGASRGEVMIGFSDSPEFVRTSGTEAPLTSNEAALRRLYAAYFLRNSDQAGLAFWQTQLENGVTLEQVSAEFAVSGEFDNLYGEVDNNTFVRIAYMNVFGRMPDPDGGRFWQNALDQGQSRGDLMVALANSTEMIRQTTASGP